MSDDLHIVPYVNTGNGAHSLTDEVMAAIFYRAKEKNLIRRTFTDGKIREVGDWMAFIRNPGNVIHTVWSPETCVAVAWLMEFGTNYATAHFFMFPEIYGRSVDVGKLSLNYWFSFQNGERPLLDVICGQTPANNRLALKFIKKIGFETLGTIPKIAYNAYTGEWHGMVISYKESDNGQK